MFGTESRDDLVGTDDGREYAVENGECGDLGKSFSIKILVRLLFRELLTGADDARGGDHAKRRFSVFRA